MTFSGLFGSPCNVSHESSLHLTELNSVIEGNRTVNALVVSRVMVCYWPLAMDDVEFEVLSKVKQSTLNAVHLKFFYFIYSRLVSLFEP